MRILVGCIIIVSLLTGCETSTFVPKPKGYNRIELSPSQYVPLPDSFPYQFEYPQAATIILDKSWISERYWIDLHYEQYNADIQITYKRVNNSRETLVELLQDSYKLTSEHGVKAYSIDESVLRLPSGMNATLMELSGEVPSQFQFHVTDSTKNFLRGALYFKTSTANDSLRPVIDHIKLDMVHILNTLKWDE
ncbi:MULTISPECIES: gliding motility lipoprotein GldD [Reichenbachiella]|uniref:gliding motility lipoprotein GldD n=1 Tax=Reichenbachiella TaxID=156993 RepID=UPI000E6B5A8C|nr:MULTISPECIES: gliding motility lipoprotein GldD [Reichenbachiella]MBU2915978.1 gliding motility lipoprotein GldD [Reichenbachiella agariperforans]RJE71783.1 gliding motility lipoprotein GldD [Reichenbachiella sp. MSK19-1]